MKIDLPCMRGGYDPKEIFCGLNIILSGNLSKKV
jgi:hypothetical protein